MTVIYPTENYFDEEDRNRPDRMAYDLNEEKKIIAEATEEIKKELLGKWQKRYAGAQIFPDSLNNINPSLIEFLLSFNSTIFYDDLAKKFRLNQEQRDLFPQIIWNAAIKKNWNEAEGSMGSKLNLSPEISSQIIQLINQNILYKSKELSESQFVPQKKIISGGRAEIKKIEIPVSQAISTYPKVGEQLITSGMIKLKIFPQPVRPSIKNWIEDYRSMMGAERHGMMERGNYLFHSENAKRITFEERKKLAEILRSLDEGIALKIDSSNQQVIFSEIEVSQPAQPAFSQPQMPSAPASSGARGGKNIENYNPVSTNPLPRRQAPSYPLKSEQPITGAQNPFPAPQKEQPRPSYASSYNTQAGKSFDEIDSNSNSVKFSSPQVLSSEKNDRSSGYNVPSKKSEPRIQGNVVDLKN